jgi:hypothetical protein
MKIGQTTVTLLLLQNAIQKAMADKAGKVSSKSPKGKKGKGKSGKGTVRLGSRCRSVFKTREFRFNYLTNMKGGIK